MCEWTFTTRSITPRDWKGAFCDLNLRKAPGGWKRWRSGSQSSPWCRVRPAVSWYDLAYLGPDGTFHIRFFFRGCWSPLRNKISRPSVGNYFWKSCLFRICPVIWRKCSSLLCLWTYKLFVCPLLCHFVPFSALPSHRQRSATKTRLSGAIQGLDDCVQHQPSPPLPQGFGPKSSRTIIFTRSCFLPRTRSKQDGSRSGLGRVKVIRVNHMFCFSSQIWHSP